MLISEIKFELSWCKLGEKSTELSLNKKCSACLKLSSIQFTKFTVSLVIHIQSGKTGYSVSKISFQVTGSLWNRWRPTVLNLLNCLPKRFLITHFACFFFPWNYLTGFPDWNYISSNESEGNYPRHPIIGCHSAGQSTAIATRN